MCWPGITPTTASARCVHMLRHAKTQRSHELVHSCSYRCASTQEPTQYLSEDHHCSEHVLCDSKVSINLVALALRERVLSAGTSSSPFPLPSSVVGTQHAMPVNMVRVRAEHPPVPPEPKCEAEAVAKPSPRMLLPS